MTYKEALEKIPEYTYALLYKFSEQKLCRASELTKDDFEECTEARIFSTESEIHLFPQEEKVYISSDADYKEYSDVIYELDSKYRKMGNRIVIRRYLSEDSDGQMRISQTRLQNIIQEERYGESSE